MMMMFEALSAASRLTTDLITEPKSEAQRAFDEMMDIIDAILRDLFMTIMLTGVTVRAKPAPVIGPIRPMPSVKPVGHDVQPEPAPGERKRFSIKDVQASRGPRIEPACEAAPRNGATPFTVRRLDMSQVKPSGPGASLTRPGRAPRTLDFEQENGMEEYRPRRRFSFR